MSALAYVATGFIIFVIGVWVGQSLAFHVMRKHWLNQARRTEEAERQLAEMSEALTVTQGAKGELQQRPVDAERAKLAEGEELTQEGQLAD